MSQLGRVVRAATLLALMIAVVLLFAIDRPVRADDAVRAAGVAPLPAPSAEAQGLVSAPIEGTWSPDTATRPGVSDPAASTGGSASQVITVVVPCVSPEQDCAATETAAPRLGFARGETGALVLIAALALCLRPRRVGGGRVV